MHVQVADREQAHQRSHGAKWQADAWPGPDLAQRRLGQAGVGAYGQRGRNEQPSGASAGSGGAPGIGSADAARAADRRQRVEQPLRVRVLRRAEHGGRRAALDDPARVHHGQPVARLGQHGEVVADQDQRQAELAPQPREQVEHLRLHDHVERGRRLVGDHQRRAGTRARARSSPAGAGRRRAGAGTRARARRRARPCVSSSRDPLAQRRAAHARLVQPDRLGDLARRRAAPGRARSSRPGRRARRAASARAACRARCGGRSCTGSSTPGGYSVIVPLGVERRRQQLHDRQRRRRLAAAGLAGQPERLARLRRQVDARRRSACPRWWTCRPSISSSRSLGAPAAAG